MRFLELEINNFLGIGEAKIGFGGGLVLIEGINNDADGATSNGSGKSSLLEALCYVLYGITKRGLKGDDVINNKVKKGCRVALKFMQNGTTYRVIRARKDDELGTGLFLSVMSEKSGDWEDLTKGTVKDTQALLEEIIKISPLTFMKMVFFGQDDVKPFASLTDAELKQVFDQALGLTRFSDDLMKVKGYAQGIGKTKSGYEDQRAKLEDNIKVCEERIETLTKTIEEMKGLKELETKVLTQEIGRYEEEIGAIGIECDKAIERFNIFADEITKKIVKLDDFKKLLMDFQGVYDQKIEELVELKTMQQAKKRELERLYKQYKSAQDLVGENCTACGRVFKPEDISKLSSQLVASMKDLTEYIEAATLRQNESKEKVEDLKDKKEKLEGVVEELKDLKNNLETERVALKIKLDNWDKKVESLKEQIEAKKKRMKEVDLEIDTQNYMEKLALIEDEMKACEAKKELMDKEIAQAQDELDVADMLVSILGNGGVKSYVFDGITPELNATINEYMNVLDPDIFIDVSTVTKLKSGEFRERFGITVHNKNGAFLYQGNSSGEKQKINLVIALAFNRLVRLMSEEDVPVLVLDEPFESLDETGCERVMDLIMKIDAPNIFLITHNLSLKDLIPNRIVVEKTGGIARVLG